MPDTITALDIEKRADVFWARVDRSAGPDGCWPWTGKCTPDGYGQVGWLGHTLRSHRVAYILAHGEIPDGLYVLHGCPGGGSPACVNPAHLRAGTHLENMEDRDTRGRKASGDRHGSRTRPECRPRGERVAGARLTEDQVRAIRIRAAGGERIADLARAFGVGFSTAQRVIRCESWQHVR